MASHLAAPVAAPDAAPGGAPKLGTKRKEPEPEPEPDRQADEAMQDYMLAESLSSAAANRLRSIPPVATDVDDDDEDRELAEWVAATADEDEDRELAEWIMAAVADEHWALVHAWQAKLGIVPAPDHLVEPYDLDPERFDYLDSSVLRPEGCKEKESKRRLGKDGLVRFLD
ncbi:hypothetical protein PVAP13_4NG198411 [Panicum virgatum]|uniref:Uncharacterized protein n=1 Tax=Panicum virgatum TaxID=38727 RepID=A0A8T0T6Z5_PANVG|nr:hypothetical protein PVAP13_4NG198411 [Panicum virgatum]